MAQKWPNLVQNLHFWSFWAKYCHFLHILSNARPKNNANKVPRWVFRYVSNKTFDFSSKKRIFCPETTKLGPNLAFLTIAGSFGALLMGWLVVVARGLYLARHLFTLSLCFTKILYITVLLNFTHDGLLPEKDVDHSDVLFPRVVLVVSLVLRSAFWVERL